MTRVFVQCEWPLPDPSLQRRLFETGGLGDNGQRYTITSEGRLKRHAAEELGEYKGPRILGDIEVPIHGTLRLTARQEPDDGTRTVLVARFEKGQVVWIKPSHEVGQLQDQLWEACQELPGDYKPWGTVDKDDPSAPDGWWQDCSSGCRHFFELRDTAEEPISFDWGVCTNPRSHRRGLLTFEHQGCPAFEAEDEPR